MSIKVPFCTDDSFVMGKKPVFLPMSMVSWVEKPVLVYMTITCRNHGLKGKRLNHGFKGKRRNHGLRDYTDYTDLKSIKSVKSKNPCQSVI